MPTRTQPPTERTQIDSGGARDARLRHTQAQYPERFERCGVFKLSALSSDGRSSRSVRRGTLAQLFCGTQARKIFFTATIQKSATPNKTISTQRATLGGKLQAHRGRSPSQHARWAPVPSSMGKPYRALAGPLDFPHPWYMLQAQAIVVSPPSPACVRLSGQVWGECVQAPWLPRISDGTERMTRVRCAKAIFVSPQTQVRKSRAPTLGLVMGWRNTSDILRSRVSPWWRLARITYSLARGSFLLQRCCDASRPSPITTSPRAASSPATPLRTAGRR